MYCTCQIYLPRPKVYIYRHIGAITRQCISTCFRIFSFDFMCICIGIQNMEIFSQPVCQGSNFLRQCIPVFLNRICTIFCGHCGVFLYMLFKFISPAIFGNIIIYPIHIRSRTVGNSFIVFSIVNLTSISVQIAVNIYRTTGMLI